MNTNISVLMTCHNRKIKTLSCLQSLHQQISIPDINMKVYLVDDGCTDGTGDEVKCRYPNVKVLEGNGNLFWSGGMRFAWEEASKIDYDFFLWLNDDTILFNTALANLVNDYKWCYYLNKREAIISGITLCPLSNKVSYGGRLKGKDIALINPTGLPQFCDLINGNAVLIPKLIYNTIGNLSKKFTHGFADFDYGLRAKQCNFGTYVSSNSVGFCPKNTKKFFTNYSNVFDRFNSLYSRTGFNVIENFHFNLEHYGLNKGLANFIKHNIEAFIGCKLTKLPFISSLN